MNTYPDFIEFSTKQTVCPICKTRMVFALAPRVGKRKQRWWPVDLLTDIPHVHQKNGQLVEYQKVKPTDTLDAFFQ